MCLDGATLVCVEVRARRPGSMVDALESITATKRARLRRAALRCMTERRAREVRIDVVSVVGEAVEHFAGAVDFSER